MAEITSTESLNRPASAPTVLPTGTPPDDFQHIQASPAAFGSSIGQASEQLGAGVSKAAQFFGQVQTDDALNNAMKTANDALEKFKGLEGADALNAQASTNATIDGAFKTARESLASPAQQYQFDQTARFFRERYIAGQVSSHSNQQAKIFATNTNNATYETGRGIIAQNPTNPDAWNAGLAQMHSGRIRNLQLQGLSNEPDILARENAATTADALETQITALAPTDPATAQRILDAHRAELSVRPNYDALSNAVQSRYIQQQSVAIGQKAIVDSGNAMTAPHGQGGGVISIKDAVLGQESGNKDNPPPNLDKQGNVIAAGPGQIRPSTFAQYAQPGEDINVAAQNRAVSGRILDDYTQRWPNDPARQAVAYFSGPGNVAPADSPTPWVNNAKDKNGTTTSSYVSDILKRMNVSAHVAAKASAYDNVMNATSDPKIQHAALEYINQQYTAAQVATMADQKAKKDASDQAIGDWTTKILEKQFDPTTVIHELAADQNLDPRVKFELQKHIEDNEGDVAKAARAYGAGYWPAFNELGKTITEPAQILDLTRPDADPARRVSLAGGDVLMKWLKESKTQEGISDAKLMTDFLGAMKKKLSAEKNQFTHYHDPKGEEIFNGWQGVWQTAYENARHPKDPNVKPIPARNLLTEGHPEYLGNGVEPRPQAVWMKDILDAGKGYEDEVSKEPVDLATKIGIAAAYNRGSITKEQAQAAAIKGGFWKPPTAAPAAPAEPVPPAPEVPMR